MRVKKKQQKMVKLIDLTIAFIQIHLGINPPQIIELIDMTRKKERGEVAELQIEKAQNLQSKLLILRINQTTVELKELEILKYQPVGTLMMTVLEVLWKCISNISYLKNVRV